MGVADLCDERRLLRLPVGEDDVRAIDAEHWPVRGHDENLHAIETAKLGGGVGRGSSHAAQTAVTAQKPLERHRAEDAAVGASFEPFLCFERSLQTVWPVTIRDGAARELVDDLDPAFSDDIPAQRPTRSVSSGSPLLARRRIARARSWRS